LVQVEKSGWLERQVASVKADVRAREDDIRGIYTEKEGLHTAKVSHPSGVIS
jgi:hypothetical protein